MTLTCFPRGGKKPHKSTSTKLEKEGKYSKTWKSKAKGKSATRRKITRTVSLVTGRIEWLSTDNLCETYSDLLESIIKTKQAYQFKKLSELYRLGDDFVTSVYEECKLAGKIENKFVS